MPCSGFCLFPAKSFQHILEQEESSHLQKYREKKGWEVGRKLCLSSFPCGHDEKLQGLLSVTLVLWRGPGACRPRSSLPLVSDL